MDHDIEMGTIRQSGASVLHRQRGGANTNDDGGKTQLCKLLQFHLTSAASRRRRYIEVNSTPNTTHFTRATPMLDTPDVYINGASTEGTKPQNKHTRDFVQTVEYTEIDETTDALSIKL